MTTCRPEPKWIICRFVQMIFLGGMNFPMLRLRFIPDEDIGEPIVTTLPERAERLREHLAGVSPVVPSSPLIAACWERGLCSASVFGRP